MALADSRMVEFTSSRNDKVDGPLSSRRHWHIGDHRQSIDGDDRNSKNGVASHMSIETIFNGAMPYLHATYRLGQKRRALGGQSAHDWTRAGKGERALIDCRPLLRSMSFYHHRYSLPPRDIDIFRPQQLVAATI